MIRIISPVGKLQYVDQVQPLCEKQVMFNGSRIIIMARAKDWSVEPTALALHIAEEDQIVRVGFPSEELQIGNLKPEKVLEIVRTLGEKEYYDFSTLNYQNAKNYGHVVWDNGKGNAYCNCTFEYEMTQRFCRYPGWEPPIRGPIFPLGFPLGADADCQIVDGPSDSEDLDWDSMN